MSFSGQSNAPWQRNNMMFHQGAGGGGPPQQMFMQQAPPQGPFGHGPIQSGGGGIFPQGGGSVSYPQRATGLNPVAFQQGAGGSGGSGGQSQQYNSIGTVTKINSDCGLVNDEVFFYRNVCKGQAPKLGDRVLFEATFSATGQFKWNATRIQLMAHQPQPLMGSGGGGKGFSGYNAVPPPNEYQRAQQRHNSPRRSSPSRGDRARDHTRSERERRDRERERNHRSRDRDDAEEQDRKRRREDHDRSRERAKHSIERKDRERERERERARDRERVERVERSPHRSAPKGRRARTIRRYMVQIPKSLLSYNHADIQELRQRYSTLYIPSDFFHANIKWSEPFTPDNPFSLRRPCKFHIKHRIVEPPFEQNPDWLKPADADYLYSAKVMLMSSPPIAELYQKCFEDDDSDNEQNTVHPSRLISFLVGTRGRNEPTAIGGPWSPSLDGENPDKDPAVLIRTAIRTCKAMTGIDLSNCTQWYRFMELYYHRNDHKSKDKDSPPRIETVVMYLPDVHSCMPSHTEWQNLTQVYKTAVENVIARKNAALAASKTASSGGGGGADGNADATSADGGDGDSGEEKTGKTSLANNNSTNKDEDKVDENSDAADADTSAENAEDAEDAAADKNEDNSDVAEKKTPAAAAGGLAAKDVATDGDDNDNEKDDSPEPTHYSKLDLKSMKVQEIRDELIARNLPSKGVRNLVMARLAKALNTEKSEEISTKKLAKKLKSAESVSKEVEEKMEVDEDNDADEKKENSKTAGKQAKITEKSVDTENADDNEDHDDWADVIDVDMSDIVILDEYDSSKNPEETTKEMDDRDANPLIRRYSLPSEEHIIVHPYKAKNGKFDCTVKSLSVLLDYRPEDTKERFFEVSLFAELFNEMLMRDFGFNIYKELYMYKGTNTNESGETKDGEDETSAANNNKKDEAVTNSKEDDEGNKTKENAENQKSNADTTANEKSEKSEKSAARERRTSKRSIDEEPEDDSQSTDRKRKSNTDKKEKDKDTADKKMVVVKPQLLLSFVYFDTSHCGYIFEKDLEDLFSILGLNLSRGQIRKVLGKVASRQAFYYRKLTDKEEANEAVPTIDDTDEIASEELKRIALGNKLYDYIFSGVAKNDEEAKSNAVVPTSGENDGFINYNGAVIHVGKLIEQIKRTEKNFSDLEKLHIDLRKQHNDLQKDNSKSSGKIKDLQSEVKSLNRKLSDADQDLFSLNRKYRDQHSTLSYIYNRVSPYFSREKDKDKDHKSDSSRDKDADKDKEKEKDKDKKERDSKDGGSSKDSKDGGSSSKNKENKDSKDTKDEKKTEKKKEKEHVKEEDKNKKNDEKKIKNCSNQKDKETKTDFKEELEGIDVADEDEEDSKDNITEE